MLGEIHKTGQNKSVDLLFFQLDLQWLLKFPNLNIESTSKHGVKQG